MHDHVNLSSANLHNNSKTCSGASAQLTHACHERNSTVLLLCCAVLQRAWTFPAAAAVLAFNRACMAGHIASCCMLPAALSGVLFCAVHKSATLYVIHLQRSARCLPLDRSRAEVTAKCV
jgi:hypothetical protein